MGFDGAFDDTDPRVLLVRYGDSSSCPSQEPVPVSTGSPPFG